MNRPARIAITALAIITGAAFGWIIGLALFTLLH